MTLFSATDTSNNKQILVSVGIPTFNRPEGLHRTLSQITAQTHKDLEIIISDNASPNVEVENVVREFMKFDSRIRYFRQDQNIGVWNNFKFVLARANGDYFMWAADDDEWAPEFIEICLGASSQNESVACGFNTVHRATEQRTNNPMPTLLPERRAFINAMSFFSLMQPSIIYGLHYRKSLEFFRDLPSFDWADCYFVLHLILRGSGIRTIPQVLYAAGIDAPIYQIKYANNKTKRLNYIEFMHKVIVLCIRSRNLSISERIRLIKKTISVVFSWIKQHEGDRVRPMLFLATQIGKKMSNKNKNPRLD